MRAGNEKFALRLATVIAVCWVISLVLDATVQTYEAPATVHALMMIAAGWAFGQGLLGRKGNDDE